MTIYEMIDFINHNSQNVIFSVSKQKFNITNTNVEFPTSDEITTISSALARKLGKQYVTRVYARDFIISLNYCNNIYHWKTSHSRLQDIVESDGKTRLRITNYVYENKGEYKNDWYKRCNN